MFEVDFPLLFVVGDLFLDLDEFLLNLFLNHLEMLYLLFVFLFQFLMSFLYGLFLGFNKKVLI